MSRHSASRPTRSAARPVQRPRRSRSHPVQQPQPLLTPHRKKVLWAGGAITLLAMATILPTQVSSQAIPDQSCEQVVKSGAEISRGQIAQLLTVTEGTRKAAVRQAISDPYCTLPTVTAEDSDASVEREAYPLAFDPEAWVVLSYESGSYAGYDFVFKP